jgi:peptidoglycan/xylan/chitin deacetylase (PgdA/CDA1 family)
MITAGLRKLAGAMPPSARTRVHDLADRVLAPFGSVLRSQRPTDLVALTFDDGPDADVTPGILNVLRDKGAAATFFVLTDRAAQHPELIRRMVAEGHEVALHCDRHDRLTRLPRVQIEQRLQAAQALLARIAAVPVTRFRPPFGAQSLTVITAANRLGLETVVWVPSAFEWEEQTAAAAAKRLLETVRGGEIALLHDGYETPEEKMPPFDRVELAALVIAGLERKGLKPTSVARLIEAAGAHKTFWIRS